MIRFVSLQISKLLLTLFFICLISFVLIHLAPGGPLHQMLALQFQMGVEDLSPKHLDFLRSQYGFDQPVLTRFAGWLSQLIQLNLGDSFLFKKPVLRVIKSHFLTTAAYGAVALPVCYGLYFLLGFFFISKKALALQAVVNVILLGIYTVPAVILALFVRYHLPGPDELLILLLYVLTQLTLMVLLFRGALYEEITQPYVAVARSKGLSWLQAVWRHSLPNALIPIITSLSYSFLGFFAGSLFIETVFSIQGLGQLSYLAAQARDYNLMMGIVLLLSFLFVFTRFISQWLYWLSDPRLRSGSDS